MTPASMHDALVIDTSVWLASLDPGDERHDASVACLHAVLRERIPVLAAPFLTGDVACAVAARLGPAAARRAERQLQQFPTLRVHAMSDALFSDATALGVDRRLPLAFALLRALANAGDAELLSWEVAHVERLGALPPDQWTRERPSLVAPGPDGPIAAAP